MLLAGHRVVLEVSADLPLLRLTPVLLEQVLFNLLYNASKYALPGTELRLRAEREADLVLLQLLDEGQGKSLPSSSGSSTSFIEFATSVPSGVEWASASQVAAASSN